MAKRITIQLVGRRIEWDDEEGYESRQVEDDVFAEIENVEVNENGGVPVDILRRFARLTHVSAVGMDEGIDAIEAEDQIAQIIEQDCS